MPAPVTPATTPAVSAPARDPSPLALRLLRAAGVGLALLALVAALLWLYARGYALDSQPPADPHTRPADLVFLQARPAPRGKVLAVVSSAAHLGASGKRAGFELTELSRAYYVFLANGYDVDIASPKGGRPPMKVDDELVEADHAFLNDTQAQAKLAATLPLAQVDPADYAAVYFVGGKGVMFDFPDNPDIQRITAAIDARGGVVGAVCHGPAALLNVRRPDGRRLLAGRQVAGFSNAEELFLIKEARTIFPFLLQDQLRKVGARYSEGPLYLDHTVVDGRLVTGQNPWSTWSVAEAMVRALGHTPVPRATTREELAVRVLWAYQRDGAAAARALKAALPEADRRLLLLHALIAGMQGRLGDAWQLQRLARV